MKKLVSLLLAAMMLCAMALAEAPEGYPEVNEKYIQAEKINITIYDYWSGAGDRKEEPSEEEQLQYDYRDWIEATYNVKIHQMQGGDWGTCAEEMINFVSAPDGSYRAYIIEPGKVGSLVVNGVAAPVKYDFSAEKWNDAVINTWTMKGVNYGFATGAPEPRGCLYFNKRILEECNIDWNTIYDMQDNGTWTWAAFEEILQQCTVDKDNDGVIDVWGVSGSGDDMYNCFVFGNGGAYFDFDAEGKLQPVMNSEETIEALNFGKHIQANYWMHTPVDENGVQANWDWYKEAWKAGSFAFYAYQTYGGYNDNSEMADMEDEWG
ncbi:MAG: hypothetical protein IJA83_01560, partial [Clostridia bacterium]|nr:hypothetical protein [Clostridia bacterium]